MKEYGRVIASTVLTASSWTAAINVFLRTSRSRQCIEVLTRWSAVRAWGIIGLSSAIRSTRMIESTREIQVMCTWLRATSRSSWDWHPQRAASTHWGSLSFYVRDRWFNRSGGKFESWETKNGIKVEVSFTFVIPWIDGKGQTFWVKILVSSLTTP